MGLSNSRHVCSLEDPGIFTLGPIIGTGENAVVHSAVDNKGTPLAMKIIQGGANNLALQHEIEMHKRAQESQITARIYACYKAGDNLHVVMDSLQPYSEFKTTKKYERDLICKVWKMIQAGIIHNDLHQGNVGRLTSGEAVIFDFGFAKLVDAHTTTLVQEQLVIAQLYSLLENHEHGCNTNNVKNLCNSAFVDEIYNIKQGKGSLFYKVDKQKNGENTRKRRRRATT